MKKLRKCTTNILKETDLRSKIYIRAQPQEEDDTAKTDMHLRDIEKEKDYMEFARALSISECIGSRMERSISAVSSFSAAILHREEERSSVFPIAGRGREKDAGGLVL